MNTRLSSDFLARSSPYYQGDLVSYWADAYVQGTWSSLSEAIKTGKTIPGEDRVYEETGNGHRDYVRGMRDVALTGQAELLVEAVSLRRATRMIDVGGGHGAYSAVLAREYPMLEITIIDMLDEDLDVARELIREQDLEDRVSIRQANFLREPLGEDLDVVMLTNVLHLLGEENARKLLGRARDALAPGGRLIILDWFLDDDGVGLTLEALFSLHNLLNTAGEVYTPRGGTGVGTGHGVPRHGVPETGRDKLSRHRTPQVASESIFDVYRRYRRLERRGYT